MKAILTLTRLYFFGLPIQRWLGFIALALAALIGSIAYWRAGGGEPGRPLAAAMTFATLPAVLFLLPALFTAGPLFRYLSAPPSYGLLPYFRRRMLAALGLWLVLMVGLPAAVAVTIVQAAGTSSLLVPLATVLGFVSGGFYFCFRLLAPSARTLVELLVLLVSLQLLGLAEDAVEFGGTSAGVALILLIAAWIAFAVWYLHNGRVAPVDLRGERKLFDRQAAGRFRARPPELMTRPYAITTILGGRFPAGLNRAALKNGGWFRLLGFVAIVVAIGFLLGSLGTDGAESRRYPIELVVPLGAGFGIAFGAHLMASRVRRLWLLCDTGRPALLCRVERQALRLALPGGVLSGLVLLGARLAGRPIDLEYALIVLVLAAGFAGSALYAGLCRARNLGPIEVAAWLVAGGASLAGYFAYISGTRPGLVAAVVAAQAVVTVLLRWLAYRRWRQVDWLQFRVVRSGLSRPG